MNRVGFDPLLPTVSFSDQYLRLLNARLTDILKRLANAVNLGADGFLFQSTVATGNYTIQQFDQIILVTATANCTITLPNPKDCVSKRYTIKKANANAYNVTVSPPSGTIDGATTQVITTAYTSIDIVSDGTNFWII